MTKNIRQNTLGLLLGATLLLLAACGQSPPSAPDTSPSPPAAVEPIDTIQVGNEPNTSISIGAIGLWPFSNSNFQFSGSGGVGNLTFECSFDSSPFETCGSVNPDNPSLYIVSYSGMSQGDHTFRVRAVDANGNKDSSPAERSFRVDSIPPRANPTQFPPANANGWNNTNVTITWNWTDIGGSGTRGCDTTSTTSNQGNPVELVSTCSDNVGSTVSSVVRLKIDRTAPNLSPSVSPNPVLRGLSATATPNASDTGGSELASSSCLAVNTSVVGTNLSVTCTATDRAGNTRTASATYSVLSAAQALSNLINQIRNSNTIPDGSKVATLALLRVAQASLPYRSHVAMESLNAFISLVRNLRGLPRGISNTEADALMAQARLIIQSIQAGG